MPLGLNETPSYETTQLRTLEVLRATACWLTLVLVLVLYLAQPGTHFRPGQDVKAKQTDGSLVLGKFVGYEVRAFQRDRAVILIGSETYAVLLSDVLPLSPPEIEK